MLGNSYTLLIVSVGAAMTTLMRSCIVVVVGKTYLLLCGCVCLLSKRVSVFLIVILHLTRGMRHRFALGYLQPFSTASSEMPIFTVCLSYKLTSLSSHTATYPACANFPPLNSELLVRDGTIYTVRAGSRTSWWSLATLDPGMA